ncbi:bifunctional diaminohydroxyphosphoribosylaminopyrimidine deaminase/5-amino-6-(5-phosphoribosylamino)uracil reductase RibD [Sulfuriflexus mobilis]|uniref:bifunctional diaminohydroxyphosphoribosylaminopyrimidine deaminase/5-amino-6-(5-phosphoribosylamino)uracil reductase RibD n=1 Tax=Sulfuriflexus mobilis TaxID=1811807 RepID=UPI000F84200A|nr:bifunctional diaminohydroxyphosphoribosylaminopyrimidine deaminase/5-amino-6-(5-phosphoribosylamino)uracil reductase RibD [Sulfuriflexus mobilis]
MFSPDDHRYMARALQLAERGLYTTDPNPRVGCVLVKANDVVGEGWHMRAGEGHAEVHALQNAGAGQARGATAYVTLEPCSHHGRTPPCSEALIDAGVSRVVVAMQDPNPRVVGQGLARLQQAGIAVESGLMRAQAEAINPGFLMRMHTGRPYVRCKLAMSLDGRTAMASGESQWITAEAARNDVHRLRARSSAIVTGIGTVLHDDPSMTVRLPDDEGQYGESPLRVVLDSQLQMSPQAKILSRQTGATRILTLNAATPQAAALRAAGAEVVAIAAVDGKIDLAAMLRQLAEDGRNEVMLEAGATLSGAMLQAGLVDELVIYMAPILMGDGARGLFCLPGLEAMADRIDLEIMDIRAVGRDWRITARPVYRPV